MQMLRIFFIGIWAWMATTCQGNISTSDANLASLQDGGKDVGMIDSQPDFALRPICAGEEGTISGQVLTPNGLDPVPAAIVYIPVTSPSPFSSLVSCDQCSTLENNIQILWITRTNYKGEFSLNGVCPGERSLVIQNGRFRRVIPLNLPANTSLTLTSSETRLPTRDGERNPADAIPKIAVATGDFDEMECVLHKMGIPKESIDLYDAGYTMLPATALPLFTTLVNDLPLMKRYSIIFLNCTSGTNTLGELSKISVRKNITQYLQAGGRFYVTDWAYNWIERVEDLAPLIDFEPGLSEAEPEEQSVAQQGISEENLPVTVKDDLMRDWLSLFPNIMKEGQLHLKLDGHFAMVHSQDPNAKVWVEGTVRSGDGKIQGLRPLIVTSSFQHCGKLLFSSAHTTTRESPIGYTPVPFPEYCDAEISAQDRLLEFLIFDMTGCLSPIDSM